METEGEYHVSDQPRPWPNIAKEARDRAAEEAVHGIKILNYVLNEAVLDSRVERLEIARALICFLNIARLLESVGAQTRP